MHSQPSPSWDGPAAERPLDHVSRFALSLAWLRRFVAHECISERGVTSAQLVFQLVVPRTAARKCRFAEAMLLGDPVSDGLEQQSHSGQQQEQLGQERGAHAVVSQGRRFFFVSHTWGRPFGETLSMVAHHFEPRQQRLWRRAADGRPLPLLQPEEVFVWFDMFAINQHADSGQQADDLGALAEVVADSEEVLMVLDRQGSPLTRIWCLWEAWQSSKAAGEAASSKLRLLSYDIGMQDLEQVFIDLDVSKARATVEDDRRRILADIEAHSGLQPMTHRLKSALVDGAVAQAPDVIPAVDAVHGEGQAAQAELIEDMIVRSRLAGELCVLYGRLEAADRLFRQALAGSERLHGRGHTNTLDEVNSLARLLRDQGRYDESEGLLRRAMRAWEASEGGVDNPEAIACMNALALVLQDQGRYGEAEALRRRALAASERAHGPDHESTLYIVGNLAGVLADQGMQEEAEALYRRALGGCERALGDKHPETLALAINLGVLLQDRGSYGEAEPLLRRGLRASEEVLGAGHPDTLCALNNLASLLQDQGQYDEAEGLYRRALRAREEALGGEHPDTMASMHNLASLLHDQGQRGTAELLYRRALQVGEVVLGADHPDTLATVSRLALLLADQCQYDEAEELQRRAVRGRERVLGPDHPDTALARERLARVLEMKGGAPGAGSTHDVLPTGESVLSEQQQVAPVAAAALEAALPAGGPAAVHAASGLSSAAPESVVAASLAQVSAPAAQALRTAAAAAADGQAALGLSTSAPESSAAAAAAAAPSQLAPEATASTSLPEANRRSVVRGWVKRLMLRRCSGGSWLGC